MNTNLSDIDIKLLRVFCTIVECGGFTQAQSELNLSRSTVSTHMSNLETRLGFKLCNRGRAGFSLTARGQYVYEASRTMLESMGEYHAQIAQLKERIVGEITIGVLDNLITNDDCKLKVAMRDVLNVPEDLRIVLQIAPPDKIEQQLHRGQIEMAISPQSKPRKDVSQKALFVEKQLLYCGKNHPLFDMDEGNITQELISEQSFVRRGFVSDLTPYSSVFKKPAHAVSQQMEGLAHFILSGLCVGFLPESYAAHWITDGNMRLIQPALFRFDVPICLSRLENSSYRPAAAYVYNSILKHHKGIKPGN
ncbi:MAG: LysR family transcriptional regulator [Rhodothermales bacterium]